MPYELTWEPKGIYRRYFGTITGKELIASIVATQADARFDHLRYAVSDFSAVERFELDEDHLARMAAMQFGAFHSNPNVKAAIVVSTPAMLAAFERFGALGGTPYPVEVFASVAAARLHVEHDTGVRLMPMRPR